MHKHLHKKYGVIAGKRMENKETRHVTFNHRTLVENMCNMVMNLWKTFYHRYSQGFTITTT